MRGLWCTALIVGLALPVHAAETPAPEDVHHAEQRFHDGITSFEVEDFAAALEYFNASYEAAPHYAVLYNIGVTQLELEDFVGGRETLEAYLLQGEDAIDPTRRELVQRRLEEIADEIGSVEVRCSVDGATVLVDDTEYGATPLAEDLDLNRGPHRLRISAPDRPTYEEALEVRGGERIVVVADLSVPVAADPVPEKITTESKPSPVPTQQVDEPPHNRSLRPLTIATYATLGTTVGLGIATAVTGGLALRADADLQDQLGQVPADPGTIKDIRQRRDRLADATDGLLIATGVIAAATIGLTIATLRARRRAPTRSAHRLNWTVGSVGVRF